MDKLAQLLNKMIEHEKGCPRRINHFLKVNAFANIIADSEHVSDEEKLIINMATIVHDIGIKVSLEKYNSSAGNYQEIEGPPIAEKLLNDLDIPKNIIERVIFLIENHHTYDKINGIDYQILVEADFLVNIFEDNLNVENILSIKNKYFKTGSGKNLIDIMYLN